MNARACVYFMLLMDRVITLCCYVVGELIIWNRVIILCCYTHYNNKEYSRRSSPPGIVPKSAGKDPFPAESAGNGPPVASGRH